MKKTGRDVTESDMPSILDRELSDYSEDAFGHQYLTDALRNLIEGSHLPPYSIGLLGSWGTGKSTIKQLYLESLKSDTTGGRGKRRSDRIHPITFNAWRYGGDQDLKRALLRHAFIELGGDEPELRRELYQQVTDTAQSRRAFKEWLVEAVLQNLASAVLFTAMFAAVMLVISLFIHAAGFTSQWSLPFALSVGGTVVLFLAKYVVDLRLKSPTLFNPQTTVSFPSTSAEEYERLLVKQIGKFRASAKGRLCERLVIFVDDLDRLSAAEMVSGLDAVRTFLELPFGDRSDDFGVIFVISCDEDRVADALSRGRGRVNPDLPGSVFTRSDARRYLDRLFQFRLEIPPFPKLDMRQFTETKLRAAVSIASEIEQSVRLQDVVERLIHVGVQSPRNAIQILNAFTQTWWIATRREHNGVGSTEPGVLQLGAVTGHPLALAALCVLRVDFPDFYNELQKRPELIQDFNRIVFRNESPETLALSAQFALKDFLVVENGKSGNDVRQEYRSLRQYLSSLIGLRWPRSLQPLLLLAQDTVSRKYGDSAAELNDAFVSGDARGVLEALGHHLDNDDLGRDDVRMLEELAEGLSDDTEIRRVNAARVLSGIAVRIPEEFRNGLMLPLARQMINLREIRMNVGPAAARVIAATLPAIERRDLADRYIRDLLTGQKSDWRLRTGETPNLEELTTDVKTAVEFALEVRTSDGLQPASDARLREWLLSREVQSASASHTLPFAELEAWVIQDDGLLNLLGSEYSRLAISEIETASASIGDIKKTLERVGLLHARLAREGQQSRETLWQQLVRLIAVRDDSSTAAAWDEAGMYAGYATSEQAAAFLSAMARRLNSDMEDPDEWSLDWEAGAEKFLDLATQWESHIDATAAGAMLPLIISWSENEDTAKFVRRSAEILARRNGQVWSSLMEHLTAQPLIKMQKGSIEYMASQMAVMSDQHKTSASAQADALIDSADSGQGITDYRAFVFSVPASEWSAKPLQTHAERLRTRIREKFSNAPFLAAYFPIARDMLQHAPKGQPGPFLQNLFEQAANVPEVYPTLHRDMVGFWSEENDKFGSYDANTISRRAGQFIQDNPANLGSGEVFRSLADLISRGLVPESLGAEISNLATVLWPHSGQAVVECASQITRFLSPSDVGKLIGGRQPSDVSSENVNAVLGIIVDAFSEENSVLVAKEILSAAPVEMNSHPDWALFTWLSVLGGKQPSVIRQLINDTGLNDGQRERMIVHSINQRDVLGLEPFLEIASGVITKTGEPRSLNALVSKLDEIAAMAKTRDQQSALVTAMMPALPAVPKDVLAKIARVISGAGGSGILERSTELLDKMDVDQVSILARQFPGSRPLSRYLRKRSNDAAE